VEYVIGKVPTYDGLRKWPSGAAHLLFAAMLPEPTILDLAPAEATTRLTQWVAAEGLPRYRAAQLLRRLWMAPVADWQDASELPQALRDRLNAALPLRRLVAEVVQESQDGTRKFLWDLPDGEKVESVLIPSGSRRTLCISSQAGCALGCVFCATGRMGFRRNLAVWEVAGQVREIVIRNPDDKPTNVVFMGMGEPLLNWPAVDTALTILNSPEGLGIGARHITVSTVGIVPGMLELAKRPEQFRLAISLHSPHAADRLALMPIEKKYPLKDVLEAARTFHRRITFEYVLIAGKNDRERDAIALGSLARKLGANVNLLPLHPGGNPGLSATGAVRIREFRDELTARGIEAVVRRSRGLDIDAACGQLRVNVERKRRRVDEPAVAE
jgi:23S rRNA (adenine2503-C2)-methyltransferase